MVNYANSVVYKIMSLDPEIDDIYVGSTCAFRKRKHQHKSNCANENAKYYNQYVYQYIRDNGGWANWSMVVVKAYPDITNKMELLAKETKWLKKLNATLNQRVPGKKLTLGKVEYGRQYSKQYYSNNKDKVAEYSKQYQKLNKEHLTEYKKQYNQQYQELNKDKLTEYKKQWGKQYRIKNKEHLTEKIECECGCLISRTNLVRHKTSKKHIKLMNDK